MQVLLTRRAYNLPLPQVQGLLSISTETLQREARDKCAFLQPKQSQYPGLHDSAGAWHTRGLEGVR